MNEKDLEAEDLPGPGSVAYYVSKIRDGDNDVKEAEDLLRLFCVRAKQNKPNFPIPEPLVDLLVFAFERYLSGEEKDLARTLGLKRRGKPKDLSLERRNLDIAMEVLELEAQHIPLMGNREQEGAFAVVADRYSDLSESQVRDIYYEHRESARVIIRIGVWLDKHDSG